MRELKELEKQFRIGDALKDDELQHLHDETDKLTKTLIQLGPYWHFAWNEARRIRDECADYIRNRKHHDERWGKPGTPEHKLKACGHLKTWRCNSATCDHFRGRHLR